MSLRFRFDFTFDIALFIGFGVAYTLNFTGLSLHEWFGLGFGMALLVHLTLHWDWVLRTSKRLFSTTGRRRLMWLVNLILLLDITLCIASGIMISVVAIPALGFVTAEGSGYWRALHVRSAQFAIGLIAVHLALDRRWLVAVARRTIQSGQRQRRSSMKSMAK